MTPREGTGYWLAERGALARMTDGEVLRHWRRMRGLTQAQAAGVWGMSREHWNRMETGKVGVFRALKRLVDLTREGRSMTEQRHGEAPHA